MPIARRLSIALRVVPGLFLVIFTNVYTSGNERLEVTNGTGEKISKGDVVELVVCRSGEGFVEAENIRANADRVSVSTGADRIISIAFDNAVDIRFGGATRFQADKPVRGVLTFSEDGVRVECSASEPAWIKIRVDKLPARVEVKSPAGHKISTRYQQESSLFGLGPIVDKMELRIYY